jgi:hypothetical protein
LRRVSRPCSSAHMSSQTGSGSGITPILNCTLDHRTVAWCARSMALALMVSKSVFFSRRSLSCPSRTLTS